MDLRTCLTAAITLAVLVLVEVPGVPIKVHEDTPREYWEVEHGWPLVYEIRVGGRGDEIHPDLWDLLADQPYFFAWSLGFDVLVAGVALALVICLERRYREWIPMQFGLGPLLLLVTFVCCVFAWIECHRTRRATEVEAARRLETGNRWAVLTKWRGWQILRIFGGEHSWPMFYQAEEVWFKDYDNTRDFLRDDEIEALFAFPFLRHVDIHRSSVSDRQLKKLAESCPWITSLDLINTRVSDVGMLSIPQFSQLENLRLYGTLVSDRGLVQIAQCATLEELDIGNSWVTDKGMASLAQLSSLHELDLTSTSITDRGIKELESCPALEILCISDTQVTAEGVRPLIDQRRVSVSGIDVHELIRVRERRKAK